MCEDCHRTQCHPQCPNATPPSPPAYCCVCGEAFYEGQILKEHLLCGSIECYEAVIDGLATDRDYERYTREYLSLFWEEFGEDILSAIAQGHPLYDQGSGSPSLFKQFARLDWYCFCQWYRDNEDDSIPFPKQL